jgi:hypothetical protein
VGWAGSRVLTSWLIGCAEPEMKPVYKPVGPDLHIPSGPNMHQHTCPLCDETPVFLCDMYGCEDMEEHLCTDCFDEPDET